MRDALKAGAHDKFLTMRASDNVVRASDNIFVVLPLNKVLEEEPTLARDYHYASTETMQLLLADYMQSNAKQNDAQAAKTA